MRLLFALLVALAICARGAERPAAAAPDPLRVLTVGNSFAYDATHFLPAIAEAAGRPIVLFHANSSGASFEKQLELVARSDAAPDDPKSRPYTGRAHPRTGERRDFTLREALAAEAWDVVTIQQASPLSFKPETYEPHATRLIALIREHAPGAEIVVHQTWAYRDDFRGFADGTLDATLMHERLAAAYDALAARHRLRLIPVGAAFHAARQTPRWDFTAYPDPDFDYQNPPPGAVPAQPNSLHQGWRWTRDAEGKAHLWHDYLHANDAGRYLAACVWFETLFGLDAETLSYAPPGLSPEDAADLRRHAHAAVAQRRASP